MSDAYTTYDWVIDERRTWPPNKRPQGPFGPTTLEVMRSCPLRCCFEASGGYERRMGFAARVGTAFHRALQSLTDDPPECSSARDVAETARARFMVELEAQEALRASRPREARLPRDEGRISRAIEAIMAEALRIVPRTPEGLGGKGTGEMPSGHVLTREEVSFAASRAPEIEVEVPVQSRDRLLVGRVDRAERGEGGTRLVDYKSAVRDDLPERYERQLQLYAALWHDSRDEWPVAAKVIYPFTSASHEVDVAPEICEQVAREYRLLIVRTQKLDSVDHLATPGDVCKACDFRPWCKPFWQRQATESRYTHAISDAVLGFEGLLDQIEQVGAQWRLYVRWRGNLVRIVATIGRFPQLQQARAGTRVRALEMKLHGNPYQPQAAVTEFSEIFLVT